MNHIYFNWHSKKLLFAAAFFVIADAYAQRVLPPPKPSVKTLIQPGEIESEKKANKHGHHHRGHVKKDKNTENNINEASAPKEK